MSDAPKGYPEFRRVVGNLASRSGLPHDEASLDQIADNLYHLRPSVKGSENDPMQWMALAALDDWQVDPYGETGSWIPSTVMGHQIRNEDDLSPLPENLAALRSKQWGDWSGPGWSQADLDAINRPRKPFELSPGDVAAHDRMRESQLLMDILGRRKNYGQEWLERSPEERARVEAWTGKGNETPETLEKRNLDDAVRWYGRGEGRKYYSGDGYPQNLPFIDWGTANFRRYATDPGTISAGNNQDYAIGALNNQVFLPGEEAMNRNTMQHMDERKDSRWATLDRVLPMAPFRGAWDFIANSLRYDTKSGVDYADARRIAKQINTGSPLVPHPDKNPTREDRIAAIAAARKAIRDSENMSGTDWHWANTGEDMSYAGSLGTTLLSSLFGDPTVAATGLWGGLGAKAAMKASLKAGGSAAGKAPWKAAVGAFTKGFGSEVKQEALENAGFLGASSVFPLGEGLSVPHMADWFDPAMRTDLPSEKPEDRTRRLQREEEQRTKAALDLQEMNKHLPKAQTYYGR